LTCSTGATDASLIYRKEQKKELEAKDVFTKHKPHAGRQKSRKIPLFVPGDLDL